jgi:hypothetical protein
MQPNISITDPAIIQLLNGTWYLQYTSPSSIENITQSLLDGKEEGDVAWKPNNAQYENVETKAFRAKGTVSAAGITIDTSNKLVQQIFNVDTNTVTNQITFDNNNGYGIAGGTYRPSTIQPNRAIVAFNQAKIIVSPIPFQRLPTTTSSTRTTNPTSTNTIAIDLGWIFTIISLFRKGNRDNGWLETTYIDDTLRIGRGNKGTMFILTREPLSL